MNALTSLGIVHTAVSVVALIAGFVCLARDKAISPATRVGQLYVVTTAITCLTAFGIFRHGGFGPAHVLAVITLAVLAVGTVAAMTTGFGRASAHVQTMCYSATFFFSMIPGVTETTTRLPPGAPLLSSPDAPALKVANGVLFVLFLIGVSLQIRRLRAAAR
jgi:uncharacterized membrane protein